MTRDLRYKHLDSITCEYTIRLCGIAKNCGLESALGPNERKELTQYNRITSMNVR